MYELYILYEYLCLESIRSTSGTSENIEDVFQIVYSIIGSSTGTAKCVPGQCSSSVCVIKSTLC